MVMRYYRNIVIHVVGLFFIVVSSNAKNIPNTLNKPCKPGRIIFITGSCSAGKTSLAKIIAKNLKAESFAFDEFAMPIIIKRFIAKYHGKLVAKIVIGIAMHKFFSSVSVLREKTKHKFKRKFLADLKRGLAIEPTIRMYEKVKETVSKGYDVVVESPLCLFNGVTCFECLEVLKDMDITYVLVYCPWDHLVKRLEKCNRSKDSKNHREIDWVLGNYVQYIEPSLEYRNPYFLEQVNGEHVHSDIEKYVKFKHTRQRKYFLEEARQAVLTTFPTKSMCYVYPRFVYDIIIDTSMYSPAQGASVVLHELKQVQ